MASKKVSHKCKFEEGEKVLCYEPDPAKTKVLYDSKVLKVVPEKDDQGRKFFKFLIHFQGWNSTWDRYVTDEFILKDIDENRELQKVLAEEAQLTPGGHLYRRDRKRRAIKTETKPLVVEELSENAIDDNTSMVEEIISVPSDTVCLPKRRVLNLDFPISIQNQVGYICYLIYEHNNLVKLPCQPNVASLLENYLKYLARNNFSDNRTSKKVRHPEVLNKQQLEKRYQFCEEVLDGLRICFNEYLFRLLLINENEQTQYFEALKMTLELPVNNTPVQNGEQIEHNNCNHNIPPNGEEEGNHINDNKNSVKGKRENTRSSTSQYASSQRTCSDCSLTKSQCSKIVKDTFEKVRDEYVSKADMWKAVPDSAYFDDVKQPALVYGVHHFLRLLDKLPKILKYTELPNEKISVILSHCNGLLEYLTNETYLNDVQYYVKKEIEVSKPNTSGRNHKNHKNI